MSLELKTDREISRKEMLTYYLNMFEDRRITGLIDMAHYKRIKEVDPDYSHVEGNGQRVSVKELIDGQKKKVLYSRDNINYIKELFKIEESGEIEKLWEDEALLTELELLAKSKVGTESSEEKSE